MVLLRLATLFLLPMTAVHPGFNITAGDVGLLVLMGMAATNWPGFAPRPYLFLAATLGALVTLSSAIHMLRPGSMVRDADAVQAVLLFLFVLPLGWAAFGGIRVLSIAKALAFSATLQSLVALVQIGIPELRLPTQPALGLGEFGSRPLGLVGNPNALGLVCSWSLPFFWFVIARTESPRARWLWALALVITTAGGLVGFSKMALMTVPLALVLGAWSNARRREGLFTLTLAAGAAVWTLGPVVRWFVAVIRYRLESSASLSSRSEGWIEAWERFGEWVWIGAGPGMDALFGPGHVHMHNPYVGIATQFGIASALLLLSMKLILFLLGLREARHPSVRVILVAYVVAELGLLVHPLYWVRGHFLPMLLMVWCLAHTGTRDAGEFTPAPREPGGGG